MTGTACEFSDFTDNTNFKSRQFDFINAWRAGKIITGCELTEISNSGASVLVPEKKPTTTNAFDLVILSPEKKGETLTTIQAELCWINEIFSDDFKQIGLQFNNLSLINQRAISILADQFPGENKIEVRCNLLAR